MWFGNSSTAVQLINNITTVVSEPSTQSDLRDNFSTKRKTNFFTHMETVHAPTFVR